VARAANLLNLGVVRYEEAWDLQRSLAGAVAEGALPDTVVLLEHPPVVTLGRRTDPDELHIPEGADVDIVETDRGGKSTYHGPGQLVCYPIFDLTRHGQDVKKYCRDLEEALIRTLRPLAVAATRIEGVTGIWVEASLATPAGGRAGADGAAGLTANREAGYVRPAGDVPERRPPRKIASIGIHISKWVTTHGYALNVDLDPAPFTDWITACGLEDAHFTTVARELGRPVGVEEVRPHAATALADVFGLEFEELREPNASVAAVSL
jgi:lipoyl(octanoyl) transferase